MKQNKLKFNALSLSEIGFGASPLGNVYQPISLKEAKQCVSTALDAGITYFDVAPYYGLSLAEQVLGQCLPKNKSNIQLSTKIGRYNKTNFDYSKKKTESSLLESMQRLKSDYLDIVFCHDIEFANITQLNEETLPFLETCKQKGMIGSVGISGYPLPLISDVSKHEIVTIVLSYGHYQLLNQGLIDTVQTFTQHHVDVINASPFAMGLLTNNNCPEWHPYPHKEKLQEKIQTLPLNKSSIEEEAIKFSCNQTQFASTLIGFSSTNELKKTLQWFDTKQKNNHHIIQNHLNEFIPISWDSRQ